LGEAGEVDLVVFALLIICAYLMGSIPTAYIVVRWLRGLDIRLMGSKNVGTLNAYHQAGIIGAALVLTVDTAKGALAVLAPGWLGAPDWSVYITTILVVVGHNWSVFLRFRGGKGVASALGISLVIVPQLTLIALALTILLVALTRNMIIGVGAGFMTVNALAIATHQDAGQVGLCLLLTFLVVGTYVVTTWGQIGTAIKTRQFRGLFYGRNFNP
jgi:glycerol-3-phosphate acyltransferase PlsY